MLDFNKLFSYTCKAYKMVLGVKALGSFVEALGAAFYMCKYERLHDAAFKHRVEGVDRNGNHYGKSDVASRSAELQSLIDLTDKIDESMHNLERKVSFNYVLNPFKW